ncbi:MAG TPA: hypothetical protein VG097_14235, partial [Gemmata sp.]|nr:hypothetical protein [Gemmata sp.]
VRGLISRGQNKLRQYVGHKLTGEPQGRLEQSFGVTDDKIYDNVNADGKTILSVSNLTNERSPIEVKESGSGKSSPLTSVLALLKKGAKLDEIRKQIRYSIAPEPENLASQLNKWLAAQDPPDRTEQMTFAEKQAIVEFLNLISEVMQQPLFWRGEECRLTAFRRDINAPGYIRVRPPGVSAGFTEKNLSDLLKEAPFGFDRESSLHPASEMGTEQTTATEEGDNKSRKSWEGKEVKRKSDSRKKKSRG